MIPPLDFSRHTHRCLFQNDCVQAHLVGLRPDCPCFRACLATAATLLLTFGEAQIEMDGTQRELRAGEHLDISAATTIQLRSGTEADVMLLMRDRAA